MRRLLAAALTLLAASALADEAGRAGAIVVLDPWARASVVAGRPGAAYFTLRNDGAEADRLVAVSTPQAGMAMLHATTISAEGVARMEHLTALEAPAGAEVILKPGGTHVMLMNLAAPLKTGDAAELTLTFEKAGAVTVTARVLGPAATGPTP